jgi:putative endonuclease
MYYVYLIRSTSDGRWRYIGCSRDLKRRLHEHNAGRNRYTRGKGPFELVYYEAYRYREEAFRREHNLKLFANAYTGLRRRLPISFGEAM